MKLTNFFPIGLSLLPLISSKSYCPPQPACEADQIVLWNEFVDELWIKKNVSLAFNTYVDVNYIQHNPYANSGRQPAIDYLTPLWPLDNFTIIHNGFYNNTGYLHYRVDTAGQYPQAITDILRYNGTCIMEHWDVIESWSPNFTNPLALFWEWYRREAGRGVFPCYWNKFPKDLNALKRWECTESLRIPNIPIDQLNTTPFPSILQLSSFNFRWSEISFVVTGWITLSFL